MAAHSVKSTGTARVAVVGAATAEGTRLREALAALGVPGPRVDLYGVTTEETVLSEYAGEARLIQDPELGGITAHEVVFLCEGGDLSRGVAQAAGPETVLIDLVDSLRGTAKPRLIHMDLNRAALEGYRGPLAVPHPIAATLSEILAPLEREFGVEEALAVVLRPAADFGEEGLEELREQTVRLLNFTETPTRVFGAQLSFNVIPHPGAAQNDPRLPQRIAENVADLLGWSSGRLAARLLTVPVFHGHGLQLRVRLEGSPAPQAVQACLDSAGFVEPSASPVITPLDLTGESRTRVSAISADGLDGFWLWAVTGEMGAKGAEQAVRLAHALSDL